MAKLKDIWKGHPFVRYAAILLLAGIVFLFIKKDNLVRLAESEITIHRQQKEIEYLENEIKRLDAEASLLTQDRDSLEKMARETFQFCEPGEDVYLVEKSR